MMYVLLVYGATIGYVGVPFLRMKRLVAIPVSLTAGVLGVWLGSWIVDALDITFGGLIGRMTIGFAVAVTLLFFVLCLEVEWRKWKLKMRDGAERTAFLRSPYS